MIGGSVLRQAGVVVALVTLAYVGICVALYFMQRSMLYFPTAAPTHASKDIRTFSLPGAEVRVTVRPRDGDRAVLYFGGNAEDVAASLPDLERAFPDAALHLVHYRGYGGSTGKPTESHLHDDALAVFDAIRAEHRHVTVVGRSLGSGVAVRLASRRDVARLVLVTPYDSIVELARSQFPFVPVSWLMIDTFESWRHAPAVRAPTTIVAAERDEVIPAWSSEKLRDRFAPGVATYDVLPGAGHNTLGADPRYARLLSGQP